jgi:hypothetical protein
MTLPTRPKENPWKLKTPPGTSEFTMHTDTKDVLDILVCTVGKTILHYDSRCINDLHAMLKAHGDWMELGGTDEQKPARDGTVEAWGRSPDNPIGGWYGLKKGLRGRFGVYIPPLNRSHPLDRGSAISSISNHTLAIINFPPPFCSNLPHFSI